MMLLLGLLLLQFVVLVNCIQCYSLTQTQIEECHQCSTTIFSSDNGKSWLYSSKKCWIEPCNDFVQMSFSNIYRRRCCNTTLCNDGLFIDFSPRYRNDPITTTTRPSSSGRSVFSQLTISLSLSTSYSVKSSISPMSSPSPTTTTLSIEGSNYVLYIIISIVALLIIIFALLIAVIVFARKCISKTTYSIPIEESQSVHGRPIFVFSLPLQTLPPQSNNTNPMSYL